MAAPTSEALRQKIGGISLERFLSTPTAEQETMLRSWRAAAEAVKDHASLDVRWSARDRLRRLVEWAEAAGLSPTPALPAT